LAEPTTPAPGVLKGHAMNLISIAAVIVSLVLGFLAGMRTFKRSLQWCSNCGLTLTCPGCVQLRAAQPTRPEPCP
jgi:hypothetical protein